MIFRQSRSIVSHMTTYSEYASVTKYHSTYLNHLGGNYEYNMLQEIVDVGDDEDDDHDDDDADVHEQQEDHEKGNLGQQGRESKNNGNSVVVDDGLEIEYDGGEENCSSSSDIEFNDDDSDESEIDQDEDVGDMMSIDVNTNDGNRPNTQELSSGQQVSAPASSTTATAAAGSAGTGSTGATTNPSHSIPTFRHNGQNLPITQRAISTISIAFSHDKQVMASTHGDHTIKITCTKTGRLLQTLVGHPRTPWTVKFHPTSSSILASGCLGHQVRLWDWTAPEAELRCLSYIRLEFAIISLSFHPSGQCLAIANGTRLHFWGDLHNHIGQINGRTDDEGQNSDVTTVDIRSASSGHAASGNHNAGNEAEDLRGMHGLHRTNNNISSTSRSQQPHNLPQHQNQQQRPQPRQVRALLTEVEQRHMLRCVHFPPNGTTLIVGGVNPSSSHQQSSNNRGGISGGGMSFYLRMWDFDLDASAGRVSSSSRSHHTKPRRAISNVSC